MEIRYTNKFVTIYDILTFFVGTCTCSSLTYADYGNCDKTYEGGYANSYKGPICFVEQPSNCPDLEFHEDMGEFISWYACESKYHLVLLLERFYWHSM